MEAPRQVAAAQLVVAAHRHPDCGTAVPEDIERRADTRVEIRPLGHALELVNVTRRHVQPGGQVRLRIAIGDVVPTHAQVQGQATEVPRILHEDADLMVLALLLVEGHREVLNRGRPAVEEIVVEAIGMVEAARFIVEGLLVADPQLQIVAAGHVGQRKTLCAAAGPGSRRRQVDGRAIPEVGAALEDRPVVARDARHGEIDPVGDLPRSAGFEQQLAGDGRCPRSLDDTGRPEVPTAFRFDGVGAGERPRGAAAILLDVAEKAELVLFRRLPRRSQRVGPEPVEGGRRTRQVRFVSNRRRSGDPGFSLELVEIRARLIDARAPSADRRRRTTPCPA